MPIIALEGPNLSGKTTLFNALRDDVRSPLATFVSGLPLRPELYSHMAAVEERHLYLWTVLYESAKLYICDRHPAVSEPVYAALNGREPAKVHPFWYKHIFVVYLRPTYRELLDRLEARGDELVTSESLCSELDLYDAQVKKFRTLELCGGGVLDNITRIWERYPW